MTERWTLVLATKTTVEIAVTQFRWRDAAPVQTSTLMCAGLDREWRARRDRESLKATMCEECTIDEKVGIGNA